MTGRHRIPLLLASVVAACGPEPASPDDGAGSATGGTTGPSTTGGETSEGTATSGTGGTTGDASGTGGTAGTTEDTSGPGGTTGPDPGYRRECQPGDFVCDDWGCEVHLASGECYARCTPNSEGAIGGRDDECVEPQRPFCAQVGLALGGDYDCNGCAHVCVAREGIDQCGSGPNACYD